MAYTQVEIPERYSRRKVEEFVEKAGIEAKEKGGRVKWAHTGTHNVMWIADYYDAAKVKKYAQAYATGAITDVHLGYRAAPTSAPEAPPEQTKPFPEINVLDTIGGSETLPKQPGAPTETITGMGTAGTIEGLIQKPTHPQDEIGVGSGGVWDVGTRSDFLEKTSGETGPRVGLPGQLGIIESRIISPQETVSIEGERLRIEQERMGREQFDRPLEDALAVSHMVVGYPEYYPDTASQAIAAGVEWAITLPAETLRSPVTIAETVGYGLELGPGELGKQLMEPIETKPFVHGTKALLTAGLIILPTGIWIAGKARARGVGPTYRMAAEPPPTRPTMKLDYISDFEFIPVKRGEGIRGTGTIMFRQKGAETFLRMETLTKPKGEAFETTIRKGAGTTRSRMDLITRDETLGKIVTKDMGDQITRSVAGLRKAKDQGQFDLSGRRVLEEELIGRRGQSKELDTGAEVAISVDRRVSSPMAWKTSETVEVSGTQLLYEVRRGARVRRKTYTRAVVGEKKAFEEKFLDAPFRDLGVTQDTLRSLGIDTSQGPGGPILRTSKDLAMAERASLQAATSFVKTQAPKTQLPAREIPSAVTGKATQVPEIRPVSGLGALPQTRQFPGPKTREYPLGPTAKAGEGLSPWGPEQRVRLEEETVIRYPPGEGPAEGGQALITVPDLGQSGVVALGMGQLMGQRTSARSRAAVSMDLDTVMAVDMLSLQAARPLQRQTMVQAALHAQRTGLRSRLGIVFPRPAALERPYRGIPPLRLGAPPAGAGGVILPWWLQDGPGAKAQEEREARASRKFGYLPSLAGRASGVSISTPPKGGVTGLEIRPPVKKR